MEKHISSTSLITLARNTLTANSNPLPGFSLIEILVIIAIIGSLTSISIPLYQDFTLRSKVRTILTAVSGAQLAVQTDYFNNKKNFNFSNYASDSTPFTKANSNLITRITITNGVITIAGNQQKLNDKQINLTLTPAIASDGSITWACSAEEKFYEYVPEDCKS